MDDPEQELPIYTNGIIVKSARYLMWSVRVGDEQYSSQHIGELEKHLMNPDAKVGCWVKIRWVSVKGINNCREGNIRGFIDLNTGEFFRSDQKIFEGMNAWKCSKIKDLAINKVIDTVVDHMLKEWQKKFEKDQRIENKGS